MTVSELYEALQEHVARGHGSCKVVIDVDAEQCISDRNVLDVGGTRSDVVDDEEGIRMLFIQATGKGVRSFT